LRWAFVHGWLAADVGFLFIFSLMAGWVRLHLYILVEENVSGQDWWFCFGLRYLGHLLVEVMTRDARRTVFISNKGCSGSEEGIKITRVHCVALCLYMGIMQLRVMFETGIEQ